jgi:hypothetical protein
MQMQRVTLVLAAVKKKAVLAGTFGDQCSAQDCKNKRTVASLVLSVGVAELLLAYES